MGLNWGDESADVGLNDDRGLSDSNALLCAIEAAEAEVREKSKALLILQHAYLESVGFEIEPMQGGFINDYVYRRDDDTFLDVDHAIESAE